MMKLAENTEGREPRCGCQVSISDWIGEGPLGKRNIKQTFHLPKEKKKQNKIKKIKKGQLSGCASLFFSASLIPNGILRPPDLICPSEP